MFETVKVVGNREYYYNADLKLVFRFADETLGYRLNELDPEIDKLLDKARAKYNYPSKTFIDNIIDMQNYSTEKAKRYIRYRLLGELNWLDVFGQNAEMLYSQLRQEELSTDLSTEIRTLQMQIQQQNLLIEKLLNNNISYKKAI